MGGAEGEAVSDVHGHLRNPRDCCVSCGRYDPPYGRDLPGGGVACYPCFSSDDPPRRRERRTLEHWTADTARVRESPRDEVAPDVLDTLAPMVAARSGFVPGADFLGVDRVDGRRGAVLELVDAARWPRHWQIRYRVAKRCPQLLGGCGQQQQPVDGPCQSGRRFGFLKTAHFPINAYGVSIAACARLIRFAVQAPHPFPLDAAAQAIGLPLPRKAQNELAALLSRIGYGQSGGRWSGRDAVKRVAYPPVGQVPCCVHVPCSQNWSGSRPFVAPGWERARWRFCGIRVGLSAFHPR